MDEVDAARLVAAIVPFAMVFAAFAAMEGG
jgi:hypothetical protein